MGIIKGLRKLILPGDQWSLDVDLRYLPVARFLKRHAPGGSVLDVGSSSISITPYWDGNVIGCDVSFPGDIASTLQPVVAHGRLPFRERSIDAVISLDTLEHVPREARQLFMNEMFRVARKYVIVGFPEGDAAERHDTAMEKFFVRQHGAAHEFFVEHREYRIPRREEVHVCLKQAASTQGRRFEVSSVKNVNIFLRSIFMRTIWNKRRILQRCYVLLTTLSRWDGIFHYGTCYRSIYFVTLDQRGTE